jgi:5-methylcytosine-specific restriction endonuclease McrA
VSVLWTAQGEDVTRAFQQEDESDLLHVEPGTTSDTMRLTVRRKAIAPGVARTIHGVQGMGFDAVIYVLLTPSEDLKANGHYTSITRARKKICLLGDLQAFGNTQARAKDVRRTLLPALLRAIVGQQTCRTAVPQLPRAELERVSAQACDRASQRAPLRKDVRLLLWDRHIGKERRDGRCAACGRCITIEFMHAAHVIAVVNGGTNHVDNLRPCCPACGLRVGARNLDDFRRELFPEGDNRG